MPEDQHKENSPKSKAGLPDSSMEEIIASISRIIDEDSRTPHPSPRAAGSNSEILELTDVIEADGSVRKLAGAAPSGAEPLPQPSAIVGREDEAAVSNVAPETAATTPDPARDPMLSAAASDAAVAAFSRLGMVPRERRADPGPSLGGAERTLEQIVRDTLHPLLRAWLEEHLPAIVERLVREEIQRVVRDAGLR
jgi:hypothetical protein